MSTSQGPTYLTTPIAESKRVEIDPRRGISKLFSLRVDLTGRNVRGGAVCAITAYDANVVGPHGHSRIDVRVRVWTTDSNGRRRRRTIFARGETYCGVPRGTTLDGRQARELVLSLVAMKPGDTDSEYFAAYKPRQLDFARTYGETISLDAMRRFPELYK